MRIASLREHWGPQAHVDDLLLGTLLEHAAPIVPSTLVPLIALFSGEREATYAAYSELKAAHPTPPRLESPRARWRRRYGALVREFEWAAGELVRHSSERDAERIVVGEVARAVEAWAGRVKPLFASLYAAEHGSRPQPQGLRARVGRLLEAELGPAAGAHMFAHLNLAGFLVGDVQVSELDAAHGLVLEIPECAYHVVAGTGEPQTRGCLWVCKAACESVFGEGSSFRLSFSPKLPELGCTLRMSWDAERLRREGWQPRGKREPGKVALPVLER